MKDGKKNCKDAGKIVTLFLPHKINQLFTGLSRILSINSVRVGLGRAP